MNALIIGAGFSNHQEQMTKHIVSTVNTALQGDLVVVDTYKTGKLKNLCDQCGAVSVRLNKSFEKQVGYKQIYESFCEFFRQSNFKNVFVYRMPIFAYFKKGNAHTYAKKFYSNIKQGNDKRATFQSADNLNIGILLIKAACKYSVNVIQYIIDNQEARIDEFVSERSCGSYQKCGLIRFDDFSYLPMYEYSLLKTGGCEMDKKLDFYFECSCFNKDREDYLSVIEGFGNNERIVCKAHTSGKDMVRQDKYYEMIACAKFTFVIKPYQKDCFSPIRFFESLANGCLPLVEEGSNFALLKNDFEDLYEIIINEGLVCRFSEKDIKDKIKKLEKVREQILTKINDSKSFKKLKNKNCLIKAFEKVMK